MSTTVFRLTVQVEDARGAGLPGAFVSAIDEGALVFDADITDANGRVVLRLPAGEYTLRVAYRTTNLGSMYEDEREVPVTVDASATVEVAFLGVPLTLTNTLVFQISIVFGLLVAALVTAIYELWRRARRSGKEPPQGEKGDAAR